MPKGSEPHSCQTLVDLNLYPHLDQNEFAIIDAKYKIKVEYWASSNRLQDYKIYATIIYMYILEF
jgi:hypothetical protein